MNHHTERYEDQGISLRREEENLRRWIRKAIEDMDVCDLRMVHRVVMNSDDFKAFFRVMKKTLNVDV